MPLGENGEGTCLGLPAVDLLRDRLHKGSEVRGDLAENPTFGSDKEGICILPCFQLESCKYGHPSHLQDLGERGQKGFRDAFPYLGRLQEFHNGLMDLRPREEM